MLELINAVWIIVLVGVVGILVLGFTINSLDALVELMDAIKTPFRRKPPKLPFQYANVAQVFSLNSG